MEDEHRRQKRQLASKAEAAFTQYIVETTGLSAFPAQLAELVLTDDGSEGLPGWRWRFPSHGKFHQFPEKKTFLQWSTEQLNLALEALALKTLVLEPFDGIRSVSSSPASGRPERGRSSPPLVLYSPEGSPDNEDNLMTNTPVFQGKMSPVFQGSLKDSGLDDLVIKLKQRAEQWKELTRELKLSQQRERDFQATNAEQAARIAELEEKSGVEYILLELSRAQTMNEELKATIQKYKDEARDNEWLQERNQVLEKQLAEKTAEVEAKKEALNILASVPSDSKHLRNSYPKVVIPALQRSNSREVPYIPASPGPSLSPMVSRESPASASPTASYHSTSSRQPRLSADPVPPSRSQPVRNSQAAVSPANYSLSTSSGDPRLSAAPTASSYSSSTPKMLNRLTSNSTLSKNRSLPAISNSLQLNKLSKITRFPVSSTASSDSMSPGTPEILADPATSRQLTSDSFSMAAATAAARRITEETTKFLEAKKLWREAQRFESEVPKPDPVSSKRKARDGDNEQIAAKRQASAIFWDVSD